MAMRTSALLLTFLLIGGCGMQRPEAPVGCVENDSCAGGGQALVSGDQTSPATTPDDATENGDSLDQSEPGVNPTPSPTPSVPDETTTDELTTPGAQDTPPHVFGDFVLRPIDEADLFDLLDVLLDDLYLDALAPSQVDSEFSYLELLCRDGDLPDTYCRQRYAD